MYILKRGTSWNKLEPPGTIWNYLELAGTIWNQLEPTGMIWHYRKPPVTRWNQQQTDKKKKEIHRNKLHTQYHCPIEYNISNTYCRKEHHLRCLQVEPSGTAWN